MHATLIEDAALSIFCAILYFRCAVDPNPNLTNDDRPAPGDDNFAQNRTRQSKYIYMAISAFDIYLGYSNQATLAPPIAHQRLRAIRRVGFFIFICGALFRVWAIQSLGRFFTFRLTVRKDHKVVRTGPFALVRHPSYTGIHILLVGEWLLMLSGNVGQYYFATGSLSSQAIISIPLATAALACVFLVPRIEKEEKMLSEALGEEWKTYTREVKWRLLPGIF